MEAHVIDNREAAIICADRVPQGPCGTPAPGPRKTQMHIRENGRNA